jgi:hypothetical protein
MPGGETHLHWNLKRLTLIWAQQQGYSVCGAEVRLPRSGFRADVAAYRPATKDAPAVSAIFECKQCRADFLKDSHAADPTLRRLRELERRKQKLDEMLGMVPRKVPTQTVMVLQQNEPVLSGSKRNSDRSHGGEAGGGTL